MADSSPRQMRAVVLEAYHEDVVEAIRSLKVVQRPVPEPRRGQVLVKIAAAPCNPSDLLLLQGKYGTLKKLPTVPGWEGAGTVVASGGGLLAAWLRGKRVAFAVQADRGGTWAEYTVANAAECIPLKKQMSLEQGATLIINPFTAMGLLDTARRHGHGAAIQTAGASQLGRMVIRIAGEAGYPLISVVRRAEQVDLLKSLGAKHVLDSSASDFLDELKALCDQVQPTAAFEAVAGDTTGTILNAMPPESVAYLYGALSEEPCGHIDPVELIFHDKALQGFYLGKWLRQRGSLGILRLSGKIQRMTIEGRIGTKICRRLNLDDVTAGLQQYVERMTEGKVLIAPGG